MPSGSHQHITADQIDDGVRQPGTLGNLDALEIASAGDVLARLVPKLRERGFDGLCVLIQSRHPEWEPSMTRLQRPHAQTRVGSITPLPIIAAMLRMPHQG
jgi:hypothetical protein